jgi:hypothetical protein
MAIDADRESTSSICFPGSMSLPISADLIVEDSVSLRKTPTIASAPCAKSSS